MKTNLKLKATRRENATRANRASSLQSTLAGRRRKKEEFRRLICEPRQLQNLEVQELVKRALTLSEQKQRQLPGLLRWRQQQQEARKTSNEQCEQS